MPEIRLSVSRFGALVRRPGRHGARYPRKQRGLAIAGIPGQPQPGHQPAQLLQADLVPLQAVSQGRRSNPSDHGQSPHRVRRPLDRRQMSQIPVGGAPQPRHRGAASPALPRRHHHTLRPQLDPVMKQKYKLSTTLTSKDTPSRYRRHTDTQRTAVRYSSRSSTASPSTPTSSKPAPSPTGSAPLKPPAAPRTPADGHPVGPKFAPTGGTKPLDDTLRANAFDNRGSCHLFVAPPVLD